MKSWTKMGEVSVLSLSGNHNSNDNASDTTITEKQEEKRYYYVLDDGNNNNKTNGPYSETDVAQLLKDKTVSENTLVWTPNQKEYRTLATALPALISKPNKKSNDSELQTLSPGNKQVLLSDVALRSEAEYSHYANKNPTNNNNSNRIKEGSLASVSSHIDNIKVTGDNSNDKDNDKYTQSLKEKNLKLQLEIASLSAELNHTRDVMEAERNDDHKSLSQEVSLSIYMCYNLRLSPHNVLYMPTSLQYTNTFVFP